MRTQHLGAALGVALAIAFTGCDHNNDNDNNGGGPAVGGGPATGFVFSPMAATAYQRVDRTGMPVVNTTVITSKNAYNAGNPSTDGGAPFASEIGTNIAAYHTALDAELLALGLDPATNAQSLTQAGPVVIPDVLRVDPAQPAGFPNGRRLPDQTPDLTLALLLLDRGTHPLTTFSALPLNPAANDKAFLTAFPYLAAPHTTP